MNYGMKKILYLPVALLFLTLGCSSDDTKSGPLAAKDMFNVAYGSDEQQTMDVYLPAGRSDEDTKVIVLIHGGSWVAGSKEDMAFIVPIVRAQFPDHAIVNINYRLATNVSPAYPKQIDDIQAVLDELEDGDYHVSDDYALIGASAGAHLSMLYAYKHDIENDVKVVCDIVGPADFTDPEYISHELYPVAALVLTGTQNPTQDQIDAVNPVGYITTEAPPTISFYGGVDPLVPASQGPRLKAKLDEFGVTNEFNFYPDGGHGDWDQATMLEVTQKLTAFLQAEF